MGIENILEELVSFDSIFINLLNASISACWLVGGVLLFRLIFRKAPRWLTVALWAVVALRLICPIPIESSLSLVPTAEPLPTEILNIDPHKGTESTTMEIINNPVYSEYVDSSVPVDVESFQWDAVLGGLAWVYGMGAMLLYALFSYLYIYLKIKQSMNLRGNIYLCDRIDTPFIFGIIRPKIYLPSLMYEEDRKFVLAHENAHLKRKDYLWKPLGFLILSVYWFNPVIWLSYVLLCRDIELACDEKVIKEMGAEMKKPYSIALINCSVPKRMITACPVAFGETGVKKRIKAVLSYKKPALWLIIVAAIASIILAVCFATSPKRESGTLPERTYLVETDVSDMFRFDEVIEYSEYFTVHKGVKSWFKATPGNGRSTVLNFLYSVYPEKLSDESIDGYTVNGKIAIENNAYGNAEIIFADAYSKIWFYVPDSEIYSSVYSVDSEKVKVFFEGEEYISQSNIWECDFSSSTYGHGELHFFFDEATNVIAEPTSEGGRINSFVSDMNEQEYVWYPEITNDGIGDEAKLTFKVTAYGKESTVAVDITKVGENEGMATYYLLSAEDIVIGKGDTDYEYTLGMPMVITGNEYEWYCNPNLSAVGYSEIHFSLPTDYKLLSAECTKGTAEIKNIYYNEPDGEKQVVWSPAFDSYLTDESYEITVKALKKDKENSFTVKVIGQEKIDEINGRNFTVEFLNCIAKYTGWANYELHETDNTAVTDIDEAVSKAILDLNSKSRWSGECPAEGHIIFGTKEKGNAVTVYMLERFSSYGFVDGWFISVGGHSIPCVMRFEKKDGQYIFLDVEYAEDGSHYTKSIKRMFPKIYEHRVHNLTKKEQESIDSQRKAYAKAYLDSISREASIGDYSDIDRTLLTDAGVSVEVSNKLLQLKVNYDTGTIGWHEAIEDGVRYIYRTSYAQTQNRIVYTKEKYGTSEIVEKLEVDSLTGEVISAHSTPAYAVFFDAEVLEKTDTAFTVNPLENTKERKYGERITVSLENIPEEYLTDLYEGLYVRIYYDGDIVKGDGINIYNASSVYPMGDILNIGTSAPAASEEEPTAATPPTTMPQNMVTFDAEIIEVYKDGKTVLVKPAEDSNERRSADKIQVSLKDMGLVGKTADMKKGTKVRIYYDGMIAETYPAQIRDAYDILLISELSEVSSKAPTTVAYYSYFDSNGNLIKGSTAD